MIKRLKRIGVAIHQGGFRYNPIEAPFGKRPVCALWHESEEPTEEEVSIIERIVKKLISGFGPTAKEGFSAEGANTVTLNKENGEWTFRRLSWRQRFPWSSTVGPLTTIENLI